MTTDQPPAHKAGCDGAEQYGSCEGCAWTRELYAEIEAWNRFVQLFKNQPGYWVASYGRG